MKKTFILKSHIDTSIKIGDIVQLIDGSGLTTENEQDVVIVCSYPEITGSELRLKDLKSEVIEVGVTDRISKGALDYFRMQDIVIQIGNAKFRTCSQFVKKVEQKIEPIMKTEFTITNEQLVLLSDRFGSDNKTLLRSNLTNQLKEWFPEAFKTELVVGKWYKFDDVEYPDFLGCVSKIENGNFYYYGFNTGGRFVAEDYYSTDDATIIEATTQEVKTALIAEAKKRGYKNGNYKCLDIPGWTESNVINRFYIENNVLWHGDNGCANTVFKNGKWAEIIPTITREEAGKLLNKKII